MEYLSFFDYLIIGVLLFIIIGVLAGKGDVVLSILNGKNSKSPYDSKLEQKVIFCYALLLLVVEGLFILSHIVGSFLNVVAIVIALAGGIGCALYLKKYGMKK